MDKSLLLLLAASAAGLVLQMLVRFSNQTNDKRKKLLLSLGKCIVLLAVHFVLMATFTMFGGNGGYYTASVLTFLVGVSVVLMQYFFDKKHGLTDEQKMQLREL